MDSFSVLAAAAEAAHRDGYQVAVMARRSATAQFSFRFDGINGKTSLLLKQIFKDISCTYAEDFTAYDPNFSILGSDPEANPLSPSSQDEQSLTRAELFLEITKLFNVKISLLNTKSSNAVVIKSITGQTSKDDDNSKEKTQGDDSSTPLSPINSYECDTGMDGKQKGSSKMRWKSKAKVKCEGKADEKTTSSVDPQPLAHLEDSTGYPDLDDAQADDNSIEESECIPEDPFTPSAAQLPTADESFGTSPPRKFKPTKRYAHLPILGFKGKKKKCALRFKCSQCPTMTTSDRLLQTHIDSVHKKIKRHSCTECSYSSYQIHTLNRHMKAVHQQLRSHQCQHCPLSFKRGSHLQRHISNIHEKTRPHLCDECGKSFSEPFGLKQHMRQHLEGGLKCTLCSFTTIYERSMHEHILVKHATEDTAGLCHKCPECSYFAARKENLESHIDNVHKKIRRYACEHCEYKCTNRESLNRHLIKVHAVEGIHINVKQFQCDYCEYVAVSNHHLRRHINSMHEKKTVYECELCNHTTYRKDNLLAHIRARHKVKT